MTEEERIADIESQHRNDGMIWYDHDCRHCRRDAVASLRAFVEALREMPEVSRG